MKGLAPFFLPHWRVLVVALASTVIAAAAEILKPFPLKLIVDHLFAGGGAPESLDVGRDEVWLLAAVAGLVLGLSLLTAVAGYVMDVRLMLAGERISHDIRVAVYAHLQRLSLGFHQRRQTGDLVTRVTTDVNTVGAMFSTVLGTLVSAALTLVGMIIVSLLLDPVLALVAFGTAPLLALIAFRFRRRTKTLARAQRAKEGEIASLATESLSSVQQVKALGSESHDYERLERKSEERLAAGYDVSVVEGRFARVIDVVGAMGTAAVLVVGVFRVEAGALSPGDLVVMATYASRVYRPLRTIAKQWVHLSKASARAERIGEILSTDELLEEHGPGERTGRAEGALEFDSVSFAYEAGRPALRDVTLTISPGERVAVVGRSGAGKSTLIALAARFYDPSFGRVLIDGVDARDLPLAWVRSQVGLVLQDSALFTGTVAENIAWGFDSSEEEVVRAARAVGAEPFIHELPEGYDTELDPGGAGLSGGQRQRLAIARTLLRDPAILLLDEPTTGLDAESEAEVLEGLDVLMRGRTTVIITHALSLARLAVRAVVLDAGRVVQEGPPEELLGEDGPFRRLAERQGLVPRGPGRRAPVAAIADPMLPQAPVMLDPAAVAPVLARSLEGRSPRDVAVRYVRYSPGAKLLVHYDVAVNGGRGDAVGLMASRTYLARRAAKPENVALARRAAERAPAPAPLAYDDELGCLLQWYPLDLSLPLLATPPAELRRILAEAGVHVEASDDEPERLAYRPRRRAALGVDGHVVKLYAHESEFKAALRGHHAASSLRSVVAPRLEAALPERLVTVQSLLPGANVSSATDVAAEAGALLARLHASEGGGLAIFAPADQLQAAADAARLVTQIAPDLRPRVASLLRTLARAQPEGVVLVPCHGDFTPRHLIATDGDLGVTDFDAFCFAPAALDLATYTAYLVRGRSGDLGAALAVLHDLVSGYGERPPDVSWYLASMIVRRATRPFRYAEPNWRARVEEMFAAAEQVLET